MKYIIKHKQTNRYFNIRYYGIDLFNIGLNPKIYPNESLAKKDLELFHSLKGRQLQVYSNAEYGLNDHGKPSWYDQRNSKKLTEKQKQKLEWYERAHENNRKNIEFILNMKISDIFIEEYKE
jgi:hypothetical protein